MIRLVEVQENICGDGKGHILGWGKMEAENIGKVRKSQEKIWGARRRSGLCLCLVLLFTSTD